MEIRNGRIYIAPGMFLFNPKTNKAMTEKEYFERNESTPKLDGTIVYPPSWFEEGADESDAAWRTK